VIDFSVRKAKGGPLGCPFCIDKTLALDGYFLLNGGRPRISFNAFVAGNIGKRP
jgi:hypothetical protein